ncbi:hypothetical protein BD413DRAFT_251999 [Trametes elegans]|nr:hypothetical protein BD413DRAFT_251999 [Trametes elegans]
MDGAHSWPSLNKVMLTNGLVYFCSLATLNILVMVLAVLGVHPAIGSGTNYVIGYLNPLSTILVCRFLLDLRSVSEKLAAGGSCGNVSSLDFGGIGSPLPSEGPSFLGTPSDLVDTFPDMDEADATPTERPEADQAGEQSDTPMA